MSIQIVLVGFDGGNCSTLSLPAEIFTYAASRLDQYGKRRRKVDIAVVTPSGGVLKKTGFFSVRPSVAIEDVPNPDLIFLTGMDLQFKRALKENKNILPWLLSAYSAGSKLAAVCPSQALFAQAGLLDGKPSSIHWSLFEAFQGEWPTVSWHADDMVIEQDRIYTCCGSTSALDLALYLVHVLFGTDIMMECARWFVADTPRIRNEVPPPLFEVPSTTDESMKKVQAWLHTHFSDQLTFDSVASQFGMSERTFYRRFQAAFGDTPKVYLQKLRLAAARRLLEVETHSVESIGQIVGYEDLVFFRKIFKRHTAMTPTAYRDKFRFKALGRGTQPE